MVVVVSREVIVGWEFVCVELQFSKRQAAETVSAHFELILLNGESATSGSKERKQRAEAKSGSKERKQRAEAKSGSKERKQRAEASQSRED